MTDKNNSGVYLNEVSKNNFEINNTYSDIFRFANNIETAERIYQEEIDDNIYKGWE